MEANLLRRVLTARATVFVGLAILVAVVVAMISVAAVSTNSEAAPKKNPPKAQGPAFGAKQVITTGGPLPASGTYQSKGGRLIISAAGSGFTTGQPDRLIGMTVFVNGSNKGTAQIWSNQINEHRAFVSVFPVVNVPKGQVTIRLEKLNADTVTDAQDYYRVTVVELPR